MRKITQEAVSALYNFNNYRKSNTEVLIRDWISKLFLHWNLIAEWDLNILKISDAWWQTNTTKERLNWLLEDYNLGVIQKNYQWYLKDLFTWDLINFVEWEVRNWVEIF